MSTVGIDHLAMPTANADRLIEFYKRLGFDINDEEEWRSGKANIFSIQVGESKINVHPEGYTASLRGDTALPGSADICFVWDGTAEACKKCCPTLASKLLEALDLERVHGREDPCPQSACMPEIQIIIY
ncbi:MAG: hypothetical protein Ct9H300mP11_01850 [Chloroflexota bacterium]|nr:MAG: hypothetical protein Ct9H300mP11_01850 [Chloroflexota bacterium]